MTIFPRGYLWGREAVAKNSRSNTLGGDSKKLRGPDLEFFATAKGAGIFREISPFEKGHGLHSRNSVFYHANTFEPYTTGNREFKRSKQGGEENREIAWA